jgi:phage tail-like protein
MVSDRLIDYMPTYSRMLDQDRILEHFCDALQPQIDTLLKVLEYREAYFDPNLCPDDWLHWVGQFAGLANVENQWLGFGLNPAWESWRKRDVINRVATEYYPVKGTEKGIRVAIALWLQWEAARNKTRLKIKLPFGDRPTAYPPQWWHYATAYDAHLNQTWDERQLFGAGDYPRAYYPNWKTLEVPGVSGIGEYGQVRGDLVLHLQDSPLLEGDGSALGTQRPRMHFYPKESEWSDIFPNINKLNPEIWNTFAEPEVFGWLSYTLDGAVPLQPSEVAQEYLLEERLYYDGFKYGDLWHHKAGVEIPGSASAESTEVFAIAPGHSFLDWWASPHSPVSLNLLYYTAGIISSTLQHEITTRTPCTLGMLADIQVGVREVEQIDSVVVPNQVLERVLVFDGTIPNTPPIATETNLPSPSVQGVPLPDTAIATPTIATGPGIEIKRRLELQVPNAIAVPIMPYETSQAYQWIEPITVQHYMSLWDSGYEYYYGGSLAIAEEPRLEPIIEQHRLCNVVDQYSLRVIERELIRIPVEQKPSLDLFERYPELKVMSAAKNWVLLVETDQNLSMINPEVMFWAGEGGDRDQALTNSAKSLHLEFLLQVVQDCKLQHLTLVLGGKHKYSKGINHEVLLQEMNSAIFSFDLPINLDVQSYSAGKLRHPALVQVFG